MNLCFIEIVPVAFFVDPTGELTPYLRIFRDEDVFMRMAMIGCKTPVRFIDCLGQFGVVYVSPLYELILISSAIMTMCLLPG